MHIEIDGVTIEVIRKPVKYVTLRVYPPNGQVKMSVPLRYKKQLIEEHLQEKMPWINENIQRFQKTSYVEEEILKTGATIPFLGTNYLLIVEEHHGPSQFVVNDQLLHAYVKPNTSPEQLKKLLDRWYKKQMISLIPDLLTRWEPIMNVKVKQWGIKKMRTRWGSCNSEEQRIWLNLGLIKKPPICLEYVLVHELTHILEASHNKRFYKLMDQFMPQWRDYEYILEGKNPNK